MQKKIFYIILFSFIFAACKQARIEDSIKDKIHEKGWNTTFQNADKAKYQLNYPLAIVEFQKTLDSTLDAEQKIYAQNQVILCHLSMNQDSLASFLLQAIPVSDSSQWSAQNQADFYYNKGVLDYRNDQSSAPVWLAKALALYQKIYSANHLKIAQTTLELAYWHFEYDYSYHVAQLYLADAEKIYVSNPALQPYSAYYYLVQCVNQKFERGTENMHLLAKKGKEILCSNPYFFDEILYARLVMQHNLAYRIETVSNKNLTIEKRNELFKKALDSLEKAVTFTKVQQHLRSQELLQQKAFTYNNKLNHGRNTSDSLAFQAIMLAITEKLKHQKRQYVHPNYALGFHLFKNKKTEKEGGVLLKKALEETKTYPCNRAVILDYVHYNFMFRALEAKQYEKALKHNVAHFALFFPEGNLLEKEIFEDNVKKIDPFISAIYANRGDILCQYYEQKKDKKLLLEAIKCNTIADSLLFANTINYDLNTVLKLQGEIGTSLYQNSIKTAYLAYQVFKEEKYLNDAFRYMDRMKSYMLAKGLMIGKNEAENKILEKIQLLQKNYELAKVTEASVTKSTQFALALQQEYGNLKRDFPVLHRDFVSQPTPSVREVQQHIAAPNSALLEYYFVDTTLYSIFISKDSIIFHRQPFTSADFSSLEAYRQHLNDKKAARISKSNVIFASNSQRLYHALLGRYHHFFDKKDKNYINQLSIVSDSRLNMLSFDALLALLPKEKPATVYIEMPFLLHRVAIAYSPSWKIWNRNQNIVLAASPKAAFFSYGITGNKLHDLKNAELEKQALIQFTHNQLDVFEKSKCSTTQFIQKFADYDLLHLSLHADSHLQEKDSNMVYFGFEGTKLTQALLGNQIFLLKGKSPMLVLSACKSAVGNNDFGEGTFSLTRSFFQAGCSSIIATTLYIDDEKTGLLFSHFYTYLAQEKNATFALQKAKIAFITQQKDAANPNYWSGVLMYR